MTGGWRIDGDDILNPQNEVVVKLPPNLSSIRRQEIAERILDAPRKAYWRGRQDAEEELRPDNELDAISDSANE